MDQFTTYELAENETDEAMQLAVHAYAADQEFHRAFGFGNPLSLTFIQSIVHLKLLSYFATAPCPLGIRIDGKLHGFILYNDTKPPRQVSPERKRMIANTHLRYEVLNKGANSPTMSLYSQQVMRAFPEALFYLVDTLAVSPYAWGQGIAKRLLSAVIERSANDPSSVGVGITTYSLTKAHIYEQLGFKMLQHKNINGVDTCSLFLSHHSKGGPKI